VTRTVSVNLELEIREYVANTGRAESATKKFGDTAIRAAAQVGALEEKVKGLARALREVPNDVRLRVRLNAPSQAQIRRLQEANEAMRELERRRDLRLRVNVDGPLRALAQLRGLNPVLDRLDGRRVTIHVDLQGNLQALAGLAALDRAVNRTGHSTSGGGGRAGGLGGLAVQGAALVSFLPQIVSGLSAAAAGGTALAGSIGSTVGLAAALPGLFASAGSAIATIGFGLSGVGGAVKALNAPKTGGGGVSAAQQRTAANQLRQAVLGVAQAERTLTRAQADQLRAQQDLNDSYRLARENLEDLANRQVDNQLAVERATLNLARAQQELSDATFFGRDTTDAALAVREQQQALAELTLTRDRDTREQQAAAAKGVAASDLVVAAQQNVADATDGVADSQNGLEQAAFSLAQAQFQVADALTASGGGASALTDAFRDLSPEQARFARFIAGLKPQLLELKASAARGLLPGLEDGIRGSLVLLPIFNRNLEDTGRTLGNLSRSASRRFTDPAEMDKLNRVLQTSTTLTGRLGGASLDLAGATLDVADAARPLIDRLGLAADRSAELFATWVRGKSASGELTAFLDRAADRAALLLRTSKTLGTALGGVFKAGTSTGDSFLVSLDRLANRFDDWVHSIEGQQALARWFQNGRDAAHEFGGLIGDIRREFSGLTDNANAADFIRQIRGAVPALADLVKGLTGSGSTGRAIIDAIKEITEALQRLNAGGAAAAFVTTVAGIVTTIADVVSAIPGGASALGQLAVAFGLLKVAGLVAGPVTALTGALATFIATARGGGIASALAGLVGKINPVTVALTAAAAVAYGFAKSKQEATARVKAFTSAVEADSGAMGENTRKAAAQQLQQQGSLRVFEKLGISTQLVTDAVLGNADAYAELGRQLQAKKGAIDNLSGSDKLAAARAFDTSESVKKAADSYDQQARAIGRTADSTKTLTVAEQLAADAQREHARNMDIIASSTATASQKTSALKQELENLNQPFVDAQQAAINYEKSLDDLGAAAKHNGRSLDINTQAGRDNRQAILDAKRALDDQIVSIRNSTDPLEIQRQKIAALVTQFNNNATAAYGNTTQVNDLLTGLNALPNQVQLIFEATGIDEISIRVRELTTLVNGIQTTEGASRKLAQQKAGGGPVWGAGTATSDSIPAWLSNGEFVQRAAAVQKYGLAAMHAINQGRAVVAYAQGGLAAKVAASRPPIAAAVPQVVLSPRQPAFAGGGYAQAGPSSGDDLSIHVGQLVTNDPDKAMRTLQLKQRQAIAHRQIGRHR
jgi:hypothetical protein